MWTFDASGDTWVSCKDSTCQPEQMFLPGCDPEDLEFVPGTLDGTLEEQRGRNTCEGGDADEVCEDSVLVHVGVPLKAVLLSLWEGGACDDG